MMRAEPAPAIAVADASAWQAPVIDGLGARPGGRRLSSAEMRDEQQRLLSEAESAGRAAGLAAARKEIEAQRKQIEEHARGLTAALQALARPLAQVDDAVHEQIAMLAIQLARGLIRRELRADPAQVIGIVRDTVALLPASTQGVRVALNPEDAALVREKLVVSGPERAWSIVDDPALTHGDCRVYTDYAQIDARVETRLKEALATLLGDERSSPRTGDAP
jgi:flagellar assembly protein FliH